MDDKKLLLSKAISTKMENRNKDIKKNKDGDYLVIVGAVNHFTAGGELYVAEEVKEKFAENSVLMQRCKNDLLEIEDEHPTWEPTMSKAQWFERLYSYDKSKVAGKITELWLEETDECAPGTDLRIILIWAAIRPFIDRPKGLLLKRDLENPDKNVAFSIRSIIYQETFNLTPVCKIKDIITFDWVSSPGISKAHKYYTAGMLNDGRILADLNIENDVKEMSIILRNTKGLLSSNVKNDLLKEVSIRDSKNTLLKW